MARKGTTERRYTSPAKRQTAALTKSTASDARAKTTSTRGRISKKPYGAVSAWSA